MYFYLNPSPSFAVFLLFPPFHTSLSCYPLSFVHLPIPYPSHTYPYPLFYLLYFCYIFSLSFLVSFHYSPLIYPCEPFFLSIVFYTLYYPSHTYSYTFILSLSIFFSYLVSPILRLHPFLNSDLSLLVFLPILHPMYACLVVLHVTLFRILSPSLPFFYI